MFTLHFFTYKLQDQSFGRGIFNNKSDSYGGSKYEKDSKDISADTKIKQPTILLKTREPHDEASASPKRNKKDSEPSVTLIPSVPKDPERKYSITIYYYF